MSIPTLFINLLAILGLGISLYFTLLFYGLLPYRLRVGMFCYGNTSCQDILQTSYARLLGFPNALGGIVYYGILLSEWVLRIDLRAVWLLSLMVLLISLYLAYILHFRLKSFCIFCTASHAVNIVIFLLVTLQLMK